MFLVFLQSWYAKLTPLAPMPMKITFMGRFVPMGLSGMNVESIVVVAEGFASIS